MSSLPIRKARSSSQSKLENQGTQSNKIDDSPNDEVEYEIIDNEDITSQEKKKLDTSSDNNKLNNDNNNNNQESPLKDYIEVTQLIGLQDENKKLKEDKDNLLREKQSVEQELAKAKDSYEKKIRDLELRLQVRKTNKEMEETIASLQSQLIDKENNIDDLKQRNTKLKDEASKYQSALGGAMNVRLGNDDQNNAVQLKQDISNLQRTLEKYVTNLKNGVTINIKEVNVLIKQYNCQKEMKQETLDKPFIKAVLQRKVLQQIMDFSKIYRKHKGGNHSLESEIDIRATELSNLVKKFSETRVGNDEVSKVTAVKIRQQIYQLLGNRGFSDVISSQDTHTHNFITSSSKNLNEIMNQYRQINDHERRNEVENLAQTLIRDVLRIFWFRLMVQEPIPEIKFFESNDTINPDLMIGRWEDDNIDEICVDICYFPLIGKNFDSDYKVITLSRVLSRPIQNQLESNEEKNEQNKNEESGKWWLFKNIF